MSDTAPAVTADQANAVLQLVAAWLGARGLGQPLHTADDTACDDWKCYSACDSDGTHRVHPVAPTGRDAAYSARGPMLNMTWDWPSSGPTPTVLLEGGYDDWAVECSFDVQDAAKAAGLPVFVEPYSSYALCIYPA